MKSSSRVCCLPPFVHANPFPPSSLPLFLLLSLASWSLFLNTQSRIVPLQIARFSASADFNFFLIIIHLVDVIIIVGIIIAGIVTVAARIVRVAVRMHSGPATCHCRLLHSLQSLFFKWGNKGEKKKFITAHSSSACQLKVNRRSRHNLIQ